jgi:hypothetical protein
MVVAASGAAARDAAQSAVVPIPAYLVQVEILGGEGKITSAPAGIDCGSVCAASFSQGTLISLTAQPAAGSAFHAWGGSCSGSAATCQVPVGAATKVTASFDPVRLTVVASGSGGWITSSGEGSADGIDCGVGSTCSATFPAGSVVKLWAIRSETGALDSWTGCSAATSVLCTVTMAGDVTVTAAFSALALLIPVGIETNVGLTTSGQGTGEVAVSPPGTTCNSDCTKRYPVGVHLRLTATAGAGSAFGGWTGACAGATGATCTISVAPDLTLGASFVSQSPAGGAGGTTPDPGGGGRGSDRGSTGGDSSRATAIVKRFHARILGRGQLRRLSVEIDAVRAATADVRLRRIGTSSVLRRNRMLRAGRNMLEIRIPAGRPPGRQRLTVVFVDRAGHRQTIFSVLSLRG